MEIPYIIVTIGVLLVILILLMLVIRKRNFPVEPDYRAWAAIGLIDLIIGTVMSLMLDNPGFWGFAVMGLVFLALGLKNRDKWKKSLPNEDLTTSQKRFKLILLGVLFVFLLSAAVSYIYINR